MTGRVLTEEELAVYEKRFTDIDTFNLEIDLIATIRDRDKTIAELLEQFEYVEEECRNLIWAFRPTEQYRERAQENKDIVIQQNTILREALERIFNECSNTYIWEIAREALAKVGEKEVPPVEPNRNAETE